MKERMSGIGGNGNDFKGKPDSGSGAAELDVPKRCEGCPYVEGVTREHADVDKKIEEATKAAQSEIDEKTADCPGPITAMGESQSVKGAIVEVTVCGNSRLHDGERHTNELVYIERYNPEEARQAVSALRRSLLPDNDDGSEEGKYVTPPHWIEEIRDADDNKS